MLNDTACRNGQRSKPLSTAPQAVACSEATGTSADAAIQNLRRPAPNQTTFRNARCPVTRCARAASINPRIAFISSCVTFATISYLGSTQDLSTATEPGLCAP